MKRTLPWLISLALFGLGFFLLQRSYVAYAKWWQEYVVIGDFSSAELYEIEFWMQAVPALGLIVLGAFLVGRWSKKVR